MCKRFWIGLWAWMLCLLTGLTAQAKDSAMYQAYSSVLNDAIASCGLYNDNTDYWDYYDCGGVAYAELVDFDGDGKEELLYIYGIPRFTSYEGKIYRYRYAVWGYGDGQVYQIANEPMDAYNAIAFIKLSICPQDTGLTYLESFRESEWLAATYSYSTLLNGVWTEVSNMRIGWYEKKYQTILYHQLNNETISEAYFWQLDSYYRKNARDITPEDFSGSGVIRLAEKLKTMESTIDIFVNGKALDMDNPPILVNGCTMVPIRTVAEAMACEVAWDPETGSVIIIRPGITAVFSGNTMLVNDTEYKFDIEPVILNDTTYVPVRAVEGFGAAVEWDGEKKAVSIHYELLMDCNDIVIEN